MDEQLKTDAGSGSLTFKCSACGGPKVTWWAETCRKCWPAHHSKVMRRRHALSNEAAKERESKR